MAENTKVKLKNLTSWILTFKRINAVGDVVMPPNSIITLSEDEVMAQIYNGNKLFVGDDGKGSHARIFIDNENLRINAEFESKNTGKTQEVLTDKVLKEIFDEKTLTKFKETVKSKVKTQAEKLKVVEYAKKSKLNDHDKIEFLEKHTGFKLANSK
ncbi:hypothetical protein IJE86_05355 [bacterium]|nr:hypothetical protein [bacterium]